MVDGVAEEGSRGRIPYLAGLDGLRAVAVAAVLLFHAGVGWLPGGFLGVEIFFVLSGYLITSLLVEEWDARAGHIGLGTFWLRRARRLLPAVGVLLLVTLVFALLFLPDQVARLREDALAAALYVMNWRLIFSHQPYFQAVGRPSLLQHLWSLAVEEQFYLVWPPVFVVLMRVLPRRGVAVTVAAAAIASTLLMALLYAPGASTSRLYYGTDTRAGGLLAGATLAFAWRPWAARMRYRHRQMAGWQEGLGIGALVALAASLAVLGDRSPVLYRGGFALVALLTVGVIAAVVHPGARLLPALLGGRIPRWVGTRSYGIYLWHWPIFMVTRPGMDIPIEGPAAMVLRIGAALAAAELSYRFVERPVRNGALDGVVRAVFRPRSLPGWRFRAAAVTGAAGVLLVIGSAASASAPEPPAYLRRPSFHGIVQPSVAAAPTVAAAPDAVTSPGMAPWPSPSLIPPTEQPAPVFGPPLPPAATALPPSPTVAAVPPAPTPAPSATPPPPIHASVFAIGDSVMLGAAGALGQAGTVEVDAVEGRQAAAFVSSLQARHAAGGFPPVVVVQMGDNGPVTQGQLDAVMAALEGVKRVVFINLHVDRPWQDGNNALIDGMARRYANVRVADWHGASSGHADYFWDGIHLRPAGAAVYGSLVAAAVGGP